MHFIIFVGIPQLQRIVITTRYIPVQSSQNTFIIINQRLTSQLGKESFAKVHLCPSLIQHKTPVLFNLRVLSPDTYMLCRHLQFQIRTFIIHRQTCAVIDEGRRSHPFIPWNQGTVPILCTRSDLHRHRKFILFLRVLCVCHAWQ